MNGDKTLKDFKIMSGETSIDQDSTFNQMAKRGDFDYVVNQPDRYITIAVDDNWKGSLALHQINKSGEVKPFIEQHDVHNFDEIMKTLELVRNKTKGSIEVGFGEETLFVKIALDMRKKIKEEIEHNSSLPNMEVTYTDTWAYTNGNRDRDEELAHISLADRLSQKGKWVHGDKMPDTHPFTYAFREGQINEARKLLDAEHKRMEENNLESDCLQTSLGYYTHTVDYRSDDPQHTITHNGEKYVDYIGFDSDKTLMKGLQRAKHYDEWTRDSKHLDGNHTGVTVDTINVTTLNSNEDLQGYLPIGAIYWNTPKELSNVFPAADDAALEKQLVPIRDNAERLLYSVKEDAIVNPSNDTIKIPVDAWTRGKREYGFERRSQGDLEHVGGYLAKMANVTPEDAKQLLTPKQLEQYNNITKSIDKSQGKEVTTEKKIPKRSRERSSSLGR